MAEATSQLFPLLPLRNGVLFPRVAVPFAIGRSRSLSAVERATWREDKAIVVFGQKRATDEPEDASQLYRVGCRGQVRSLQHDQSQTSAIVQGIERVLLEELVVDGDALLARVLPWPFGRDEQASTEALCHEILVLLNQLLELANKAGSAPAIEGLLDASDPERLLFTVASLVGIDAGPGQRLLEQPRLVDGLRMLHRHMLHEVEVLRVRHDIAEQVAGEMGKEQRDYLLRQQIKKIQEELGESDPEQAEIAELRQRLEQSDLPERAEKDVERELRRLERLPPAAPEHHVVRAYVELVLDLPWRTSSETRIDLAAAREILDRDHYGLKDVKERVLEHLAVLTLNPEAKGPILCFLGPPGVGKTSLGQSIARSLGREFERMSLGGMHDEAELRGHRRTYIGAMPGRILQALRRAGVNNPLIMLDEVDKLGRDFRGDPAAALLEVLDPEQNHEFRDNYLDMPFDLSRVLFITTCNKLDTIPRPLLDRMEVLRLPGYSAEDKQHIARRYLWPRQLERAGVSPDRCTITDAAISHLIQRYTREAGVRQLERTLGQLVRKVAMGIAEGDTQRVTVGVSTLDDMLGPAPFFTEELRPHLPPGVAAGLAWTEVGGELIYVETAALEGRSELTLTGQLGDVMQESARAALSCVWARAAELGVEAARLKSAAAHIHVPSGAVPKDGPSAGVTIATALASLYTGLPVRPDTAMTGEISLTGLVLPVGGIREKLLAARRAHIRRVILPRANGRYLSEVDENVLSSLEVLLVDRVEQVWSAAIPELSRRLNAHASAA